MKHLFVVLLMLLSSGAHAAMYRCGNNGQISYSDIPCEGAVIIEQANASESSPDLEEGLSAFENGKYELAFRKLSPLSEAGIAMAQNVLGRMYMRGLGVPRDFDKALALFRQAASQGLPNAQNNLGVMYSAGKGVKQDFTQAIKWFREAANQGYPLAMVTLIEMYEKGFGVMPDRVEADRWREKLRNAGPERGKDFVTVEMVGNAEYKKGLEFYYQWQFVEAAKLFLQAAEKGHPEAQLRTGLMYRQGQGLKKDETLALYWTKKAEIAGYTIKDGRDRVLLTDASKDEPKITPQLPPVVSPHRAVERKHVPTLPVEPNNALKALSGYESSQ